MKIEVDDTKVLDAITGIQTRRTGDGLRSVLTHACALVEAEAKENAAHTTNGDGTLARSIISVVNGEQGEVGTNLKYAVYVHQGTGKWAVNGDGHQGYWVYVKGGDSDSAGPSKSYSLDEAKRVMAMLRAKGLEAYYTDGQQPNPFLEKALDDNRDKIAELFKEEGGK